MRFLPHQGYNILNNIGYYSNLFYNQTFRPYFCEGKLDYPRKSDHCDENANRKRGFSSALEAFRDENCLNWMVVNIYDLSRTVL